MNRPPEEQPLVGGIANVGAVVRDGSHVLRPSGPQTPSVHAFLGAIRRAGFDGAPDPVGVDPDGRERLTFVEGDVPLVPYPAWCQGDESLASVAALLRRLHDASRRFDPTGHRWKDALADPAGGTIVCHNDVEPSNVVFRGGVAVAFIDFEFAAPSRPVYDLAQLARLWVPIENDHDRVRMGWRPADLPARLRIVADAYGLDAAGRAELPGAIDDVLAQMEVAARRSVADGEPGAVDLWNRTDGAGKFDRRREWWAAERDRVVAALG